MIYQYTLFPIEYLLRVVFTLLIDVSNSYLFSLILLALLVYIATKPLAYFANKTSLSERDISSILAPQIQKINKSTNGVDAHAAIGRLYARYNYHPIYAIRSLVPLLVQLPFLAAAYYMLGNFEGIEGKVVPLIGDLASQDAILLGKVNLLPLLMTFINLLALYTTPGLTHKNMVQGLCVSLLFLVLLYTSPAALIIYWTTNNLILLVVNLFNFKKTFKQRLQHDAYTSKAIFGKIAWRDVFLLCAFFSFFFAVQQIFFIVSIGNTNGKGSASLFVYVSLCFVFSFVSLLSKFYNNKKCLIGVAISLALFVFLFFILLKEAYSSISYLNTIIATGVLVLLPIIFSILPNKETFNSKRHFLLTSIAALAGCAFHWSNNTDYFSFPTSFLFFTIAILGAIIFCFLTISYLVKIQNNEHIWILSPCLVMCFLFLPTIHEFFIIKIYLLEYILLFLIFGYVFWQFSRQKVKYCYVLLTVFIAFNIFSGLIVLFETSLAKNKMDLENRNRLQSITKYGKITSTPNIYFIIAESTPDLHTLELLGLPTEQLKKVLKEYDFKIYDKTYSHGSASLRSVSRTLSMQTDIEGATDDSLRKVVGGYNLVNHALQAVGYHTISCIKGGMTAGYNDYNESYAIGISKNKAARLFENSRIKFLVAFLRGLGMREFKFDIEFDEGNLANRKNWLKGNFESYFTKIVKQNKTSPVFTIYHGNVPVHSQNSGVCLENETELFEVRFQKSIKILTEKLYLIDKYDPDSIVIIAGDHGPYLTGDCTSLIGYNSQDVTEIIVRDRIGTLVSVHWPNKIKAQKYDEDLLVNQNIFPTVFAYLFDNPSLLSLKVHNKVITYGGKTIDNGVFY